MCLSDEWPSRIFTILETEVTHISSHGIWLLTHDKELFMPYEEFPWFKDQPVKSIINVEEQSSGHFYWPDIDVDLTVESIEHPKQQIHNIQG